MKASLEFQLSQDIIAAICDRSDADIADFCTDPGLVGQVARAEAEARSFGDEDDEDNEENA